MDLGSIEDWVSDHPYATGAIVIVGGLLLLWVFGVFGSSSSTAPADNTAADYYSAEEAAAQQQAALSAAQDQNQAEEQIASTQADVQNTQTGAQLQALQGYYATQQAAITANAAVQEDNLATTLAGLESSNSAAVSGAEIQFAGIQNTNAANVQIAGINSNTNEDIAGITAGQNVAVANINAQAQEDIANTQSAETVSLQEQGIYGQLAQDLVQFREQGGQGAPAVQLLNQGNGSELISFSSPLYGAPIDPATIAQMSPSALAAAGLAPSTLQGAYSNTQSGPPA